MRVIITADYESMSKRAAGIVAELVKSKPHAVLGLATGSTPVGVYKELIRMHRETGLDFSQVTTFNLDEYDLPPAHPASYAQFMQESLFSGINIPGEQTHLLNGMASDFQTECMSYEAMIRQAGGIDLQILGIGGDGHIAFAEPGSSLAGRTSMIALHPQTRADNCRFFGKPDDVPCRALTMGVGTIMEARMCLILCSRQAKAAIWAQFLEGPITPQITATALHNHPCVVALCDEAAASNLREREYYRHVDHILADQPLLPPWIWQSELDPRRHATFASAPD